MKKIVLISMVAGSALFADMMTNVAKDVAVSKAKTQAKEAVIEKVAGDDPVKQMVAKKVADKVVGEPSAADKVKSSVADKIMGTDTNESGLLDSVTKGVVKTEEPSMKDKAVDMAVEKAVGSNPLKKAAAKKAVESLAK